MTHNVQSQYHISPQANRSGGFTVVPVRDRVMIRFNWVSTGDSGDS